MCSLASAPAASSLSGTLRPVTEKSETAPVVVELSWRRYWPGETWTAAARTPELEALIAGDDRLEACRRRC